MKSHPVVALLGPRQCGKTTLARMYCSEQPLFPKENYFDLERSTDLQRLKNPLPLCSPYKTSSLLMRFKDCPNY